MSRKTILSAFLTLLPLIPLGAEAYMRVFSLSFQWMSENEPTFRRYYLITEVDELGRVGDARQQRYTHIIIPPESSLDQLPERTPEKVKFILEAFEGNPESTKPKIISHLPNQNLVLDESTGGQATSECQSAEQIFHYPSLYQAPTQPEAATAQPPATYLAIPEIPALLTGNRLTLNNPDSKSTDALQLTSNENEVGNKLSLEYFPRTDSSSYALGLMGLTILLFEEVVTVNIRELPVFLQ